VTLLEAVVLGLVQGLTEFLPVSSTAHLLIAQDALGLAKVDLHVEVAAHLGTVGAVVLYYRRELAAMARALRAGGPDRRLVLLVALATACLVLVKVARSVFPAIKQWRLDVGVAELGLMGMGLFLLATSFAKRRAAAEPSPRDAVAIGLAQCVSAIVPGWSRSGSTIGTGLVHGLDPAWAARFSFLLSIPAVLAGTALDLVEEPLRVDEDVAGLAVAGAVAFASGLLAIHLLLRIVGRGRLSWFGPYCIGVGLLSRYVV
jgi:undecaprenyl-diphosphatase